MLFLIFSWFPWLIPICWTIYLFEPMSLLSYIQLLVVKLSEKLHLVSNMGASFTVDLACILQLAPQMKVNKRADHLAAQCRRNKLINSLDSALDTLPYMIAVSQKCKFAHPCCYMLLTANAGILCVNIYRQEEAADDNDNGNCPVSHILHMIIHFSVPSLIFLFCYPLALEEDLLHMPQGFLTELCPVCPHVYPHRWEAISLWHLWQDFLTGLQPVCPLAYTQVRSHFIVTVLAAKRVPLIRNMQHVRSLHSKGGCTVDWFFSFLCYSLFFSSPNWYFRSTAILVLSILSIV